MGQLVSDIQSALIQIAKMGPGYGSRQQREYLTCQLGIAARHIEQQLPHLQRVIHESSLVLHRDQLPPLPLNAM